MNDDLHFDRIAAALDAPVFHLVGTAADRLGVECYVVGGYVRDLLLGRHNDDLDFLAVGSGPALARAVADELRSRGKSARVNIFKTYGTAQVRCGDKELEFVGARRESYRRESRNPIVEDGTLADDQLRRDFTINAMALRLNAEGYGTLVDPFDGVGDLRRGIIRTPRDPDVTFSDDPLRMLRAVRFATQLQFRLHPLTEAAIRRNAERLHIITRERVATELRKIMRSPRPSQGLDLLDRCGLLPLTLPELAALKGVDTSHGRGHKDNFRHTLQVLDNVAAASDNEWLRWAAMLHDIGKPAAKRWDDAQGWTFHNHDYLGEKMVPRLFARLRLPMTAEMRYVKKLVGLHMRPIALVEDVVTDSAVRRLLFDAGDDIDDLMLLCKADITSKNEDKVRRFRDNFDLVRRKLVDIEEKDRVRNFQPPVDGQEVMDTFGLPPCKEVGAIKDVIKDAILDGKITNCYADAYRLMNTRAAELGVARVDAGLLCLAVLPAADAALGSLVVGTSAQGVALVAFADAAEAGEALRQTAAEAARVARRLGLTPTECATPLHTHCFAQLREYLAGSRREFDLPLVMSGSEFDCRVQRAILQIPYGTTVSYKRLAELSGAGKGYQAVAGACGRNPLPVLVPCHRVVASDGTLGGYSAGETRKRRLLAIER